jgi:S-(hydroxymethyl)glutathione dehydrogenase/alcohol dehydrogenase
VTTGIGAVIYTAKVEIGSARDRLRPRRHRAERDPGARLAGADQIVGVDVNPGKKADGRDASG